MALALQAALLARHAPAPVADAFVAGRLRADRGLGLGGLPRGLELDAVVARHTPAPAAVSSPAVP
jgi:putative acyl-CoA dehydrogenase